MKNRLGLIRLGSIASMLAMSASNDFAEDAALIGREISVPRHLQDGEEYEISTPALIQKGKALFTAVWTEQEGGGRPLTKGTGAPLSDPTQPLVFPRNFNRLSGPDANSCVGCHTQPFGIAGGGGDIVANVFVLAQRFDFATLDRFDPVPLKSSLDERNLPVTVQNIGNSRATIGMFGSGFIEMLARQITRDLQAIRDAMPPAQSSPLVSKGISFGTLIHNANGSWDTSQVEGIPATSLADPVPSLVIRPFHQAGRVVSLREFSNNAFNQHLGIQPTERFGVNTDPDGDGFVNEMTRADMTAVCIFQATLAVPGRVIPNDPDVERAVLIGEQRFQQVGCASCHIPALPLDHRGWIFSEPNPYNPPTNLRVGEAPTLAVDLTDTELPGPRLHPIRAESDHDRREGRGAKDTRDEIVWVPAFTDLKLHDITAGPGDPNIEPLDMQQASTSMGFFAGNAKFLTKKLWGCANEPPFFHHGQYTTMREAVLAHAGEALASRTAFEQLSAQDQDDIIEFLKTLQVMPPGVKDLVVDEDYRPKRWPPSEEHVHR